MGTEELEIVVQTNVEQVVTEFKKLWKHKIRKKIKATCQITQDLVSNGLFIEYTILGGNHGVEKLVEQIYELPPVKNKEN